MDRSLQLEVKPRSLRFNDRDNGIVGDDSLILTLCKDGGTVKYIYGTTTFDLPGPSAQAKQ